MAGDIDHIVRGGARIDEQLLNHEQDRQPVQDVIHIVDTRRVQGDKRQNQNIGYSQQ
ncbi:hypothetical protein D3C71_1813510 [compost metagenome]